MTLPSGIQTIWGFIKKIGCFVINWARRFFAPSDLAWKWAGRTIAAFGLFFILGALVSNILTHYSTGKLLGYSVPIIMIMLIGVGIYFSLFLISRMPPAVRWAILLLLPFSLLLLSGVWGGAGGLVFAVGVLVSLSLLMGSGATLFDGGFQVRNHKKALAFFLIGLAGTITISSYLFGSQDHPNPALRDYQLADRTLDLDNPGLPGDFGVTTMTYGSGNDPHRPEYGADADYTTESVDASAFIDEWSGLVGWVRSLYWGFDETALPIQARVWMPDGEGPFPLILIVHGNHEMEDYSDPGYQYLGELFASRGYIMASVDENFINFSFADTINPINPGIGRENDARGWLLLEHLRQWRDWMNDVDHPLYGKADMGNIALIGHSRGGEAVAVAASFNGLDHYPDDATLMFDYDFNIKGIIAIAPVDGQYLPRSQPTPLKDINYFTIHGSMDGDVNSFAGTVQYARDALTGEEFHFKSSLYIEGANHGQFNTGWGRLDFGGLFGWFLDTQHIMDGEEQRQVGKVYFSAFLEATLRGHIEYLPMFADARQAAAWLPNRYYINNYADSNQWIIANYDEDIDAATATAPGVMIFGENLSRWRENWVDMTYGDKDTQVAIIAWDDRVYPDGARYIIDFGVGAPTFSDSSILTFGLSQTGGDTLPRNYEPDEGDASEDEDEEANGHDVLDWSIVLVDVLGEEARLSLSNDHPLFEQVKTQTRRINDLYDLPGSEAIMRRYALALSDFVAANPALDLTAIRALRFDFDQTAKGAIYLDDIAISEGF